MALQQSLYDRDFHDWANRQASLLRSGSIDSLDIENLAEEIESLARREKRTLFNHVEATLLLLLRWTAQPGFRSKAFQLATDRERRKAARLLGESPSLVSAPANELPHMYELARLRAQIETGFADEAFPMECPWPLKNIMKCGWFPK